MSLNLRWEDAVARERFSPIMTPRVAFILAGVLVSCSGGCLGFMIHMPGRSHEGPLDPLDARDRELRDALRGRVQALAGEIGSRNLTDENGGLDRAEAYMFAAFRELGYEPVRDEYEYSGVKVANIVAELPGGEELVLVGAHYDSVDRSPGADDNASGCAALLELARMLHGRAHGRTIRFVAFVHEEPSYFQTERMGSLVNAKRARARGDRIVAMLSLESLGFFSDVAGSQEYPAPFSWFYPDRADFIAFVGDLGSRALVRELVGEFRAAVRFPAQGVAAPSFIPGVGWSDQWSFWQYDYPAVMVTGTAPFRNQNYHTEADTPDTLDYERMARVVRGLERVIGTLAL